MSKTLSFNLLVGEKPYFQYGTSSRDDDARILEFREILKLYRSCAFNGSVLCDEDQWLKHFEDCIKHSPAAIKLTIVSSSASNCRKLVPLALGKEGASIDIYVQNPKTVVNTSRRNAIQLLTTEFLNDLKRDGLDASRVRIFYYLQPPTFRAVLLDGVMAGISCYSYLPEHVSKTGDQKWEIAKANPINLIVTRSGPQYKTLVEGVICKFIESSASIPAPKSFGVTKAGAKRGL